MNDPLYLIFAAIYASAAVGVLSCLVSESKLFSPVREMFWKFHLIFCPICMAFWFAIPALVLVGPLFYFAVVAFSNVWILIILHTYEVLDRKFDDDETQETP
jgi:hypothetical protein